MYFYDEEKEHVIIGEAALKILVQGEQLNIESLIRQLNCMAESETDDARILHLYEAKKWLLSFKKVSSRQQDTHSWLSTAAGTPADHNLVQLRKNR